MDPKNGLKRKHQSLSIQEKVEMLKKWDLGVSVRELCDIYGIGSSTVYDIKKHRDKILRFYEDSDSNVQMSLRKTIKDSKSREHEVRMKKWFHTRRKNGVDVTGTMIKDEAKALHEELGLKHRCEYSDGWLQRFKKRHGIVLQKNGTNWLVNPEKPDDEGREEYYDYYENACKDDNYNNNYNNTNNSDVTLGRFIVDSVETKERTYLRRFSREISPTEAGEMPEDLTSRISKLGPSEMAKKINGEGAFSLFSSSASGYTHTDITSTRVETKHLMKGKCRLKDLKKDNVSAKQEDDNAWASSTYGESEEDVMVTQEMYSNDNNSNNEKNINLTTNSEIITIKSERKVKENNDDDWVNINSNINNNNNNYNNNNNNNNNHNHNNNYTTNELVEGDEEEGMLSLETLIELLAVLIKGLETQSFVTEEELTNFYLMYEKLERERSKRIQKVHVREMFQKMTRFMYNRQKMRADRRVIIDPAENPAPSTSSTLPRGGASLRPHPETKPKIEEITDQKLIRSYYYPRS